MKLTKGGPVSPARKLIAAGVVLLAIGVLVKLMVGSSASSRDRAAEERSAELVRQAEKLEPPPAPPQPPEPTPATPVEPTRRAVRSP